MKCVKVAEESNFIVYKIEECTDFDSFYRSVIKKETEHGLISGIQVLQMTNNIVQAIKIFFDERIISLYYSGGRYLPCDDFDAVPEEHKLNKEFREMLAL